MSYYNDATIADIKTALGYTLGDTDHPFFDALGEPKVVSAEEVAGIEGINTANVLFGTRGLAVYTAVTEQTIIDKAKKYLKVPA